MQEDEPILVPMQVSAPEDVSMAAETDEAVPMQMENAQLIRAVSPTVTVEEIEGGHKVTITDIVGSVSFNVTDGADGADGTDGADGEDGTDGEDGVSPTVTVEEITGGHKVTITDADGSVSFNVMDGADGTDGTDGEDGADGVSPTISTEEINGGHRVVITGAEGTAVFNVMDGADGVIWTPAVTSDGDLSWTNNGGRPNPQTVNIRGPRGYTGDDGYTPRRGTDYWTAQDQAEIEGDVMDGIAEDFVRKPRVESLTETPIASGTVIETVGIPVYVSDITQYAAYGLTETGWYVIARITAPDGVTVTAETTVTGADGSIAEAGADHVDIAVRFEVAASSKTVTVDWGEAEDSFVFKSTDLAVRNLDYRTTFYLYDLAPYTSWTYALTADTTFAADKNYYTFDGEEYTLAEVTTGAAVPANTYYNHSKVTFSGMTRNVTYRLNDVVDCAIEIILPEVPDDGYGAWFEFQLRYSATWSCTLIPPSADVKVGTTNTQAQTAGINTIDLQYTDVGGATLWTLLNTHSNIPT